MNGTQPKKTKERHDIGDSILELESEWLDGKKYDTTVAINGQFVCVIAGNETQPFTDDLKAMIEKYRI